MNIRRSALFLILSVFCLVGTERAMAFYNPGTGRWISKDPLGEEVSFAQKAATISEESFDQLKEQSLRPPYLFVSNNPLSDIDPDGQVVVGIYGYGSAYKMFGQIQANDYITQMAAATGGQAYGRSQTGSIRQAIRSALQKNPSENVVLFGYSRGGLAITEVAQWVLSNKKEFPCAKVYLVGIDPVLVTSAGSIPVPDGVKEWTSWFQKNGGGWGPFKVVTLNFGKLNGTTYSGGNGRNIQVYTRPDGTPVYHNGMPGFNYENVVSKVNEYKNRQ